MTDAELIELVARLRNQGHDDAFVEAKACSQKLTNDVWPSVSSFANTRGGIIVLGLDEKQGFVVPKGFSANLVIDQFVSGIGDGGADNARISSPPHYTLSRHPFEGSEVVVIEIAELDLRLKPCFVSARGVVGGSFKRIDDKDIKLSPTEIYELQNALVLSNADRELVHEADLDDLDESIVRQIIIQARANGSKALRGASTDKVALTRLNVTNKSGKVRLSGLLVAGSYPQQFFPKLVIDVAVHPDNEKSAPDRPRFLDRVQCEGPVGEVIEDALRAISKNLRTYSIVKGAGRRDELEIPREVLREAVSNAVVHREYGPLFLGQAISVDIYPNRVEITNPGGLWGGKTIENLADGTSRCRNEALMKLMELVDLPGGQGRPAEGNGSGIGLMIREMQSRALEEPRFDPGFDCFTVTLGRGGTEIPEFITWVLDIAGKRLPRHEESLLLSIRRKGAATVDELRMQLGLDSDDIRAFLDDLQNQGIVACDAEGLYSISGVKPSLSDQKQQPAGPRETIISYLAEVEEAGIRDLAHILNRSVDNTRYYVGRLLRENAIVATAPASSRNRKYRLADR